MQEEQFVQSYGREREDQQAMYFVLFSCDHRHPSFCPGVAVCPPCCWPAMHSQPGQLRSAGVLRPLGLSKAVLHQNACLECSAVWKPRAASLPHPKAQQVLPIPSVNCSYQGRGQHRAAALPAVVGPSGALRQCFWGLFPQCRGDAADQSPA